MNGFVAGYYRVSVWVTRFAYLNLLWIGFSALGLLFVTFFRQLQQCLQSLENGRIKKRISRFFKPSGMLFGRSL
ncbi:hypothetical protein [Paracerasibacillus soli]|uniref:Uncharacterized protein n=1 Tax=Paracerasibacillus soli TaxID=480284 RepID=A0ABU5CS10_9BACI|nr:hypothetical protein [Virgibacillus soli]MDY0409153.1 hypothetical protein [Virgibacillus soli]